MKLTKKQAGFTLIEMAAVVGVIGILMVYAVPKMFGQSDSAKSKVMLSTSNDINNALTQIANHCSTPLVTTANPIVGTGKTLLDVVFGGSANVAAAYQTCYADAQVKALTDVSQPGATAGTYNVAGFPVTLAGGNGAPLQVQYGSVTEPVGLLMARNFNPSLSALAASDSTSNILQYSTITGGVRTVTVFKQ